MASYSNNKDKTQKTAEELQQELTSFITKQNEVNDIEENIERETKAFLEACQGWLESADEVSPTKIRGMSSDYYNKANQMMSYIIGHQLLRTQKLSIYTKAIEEVLMKKFINESNDMPLRDMLKIYEIFTKTSNDMIEASRRYNYQIKDLETLTPEANDFVALAQTLSPEMLNKLQHVMKDLIFDSEQQTIETTSVDKDGNEDKKEISMDEINSKFDKI